MKAMEKELLLNGVEEFLIAKDDNITSSLTFIIASIVMFVLFLFVPKIYLSNSVYSYSVDIQNLKTEYLSLSDENRILKNKIAILKYNNGVSHWNFL